MRILHKTKWLSLLESDGGYVYTHNEAGQGSIVSVLPTRNNGREILLRFEKRPCWGDSLYLASITGVADDVDFATVAKKEMIEEAGYDVPLKSMVYLGRIKESKCSDSSIFMFTVDISEIEQKEPTTEDLLEKGGHVVWVGIDENIECEDPIVFSMIHKLKGALR